MGFKSDVCGSIRLPGVCRIVCRVSWFYLLIRTYLTAQTGENVTEVSFFIFSPALKSKNISMYVSCSGRVPDELKNPGPKDGTDQ